MEEKSLSDTSAKRRIQDPTAVGAGRITFTRAKTTTTVSRAAAEIGTNCRGTRRGEIGRRSRFVSLTCRCHIYDVHIVGVGEVSKIGQQ